MPLFAGKEIKMDQQQNMELTKDQIIQELIALLNQNQQREAANNVFNHRQLGETLEESDVFMVSPHCLMPKILAYIDRETGYGINETFTFVKEIK